MGKLRIPLDFEGADRTAVDAGVYAAVIENLKYRPEVDAAESRDGKAKSAQIAVEYTITEPGDFQGEKLWQNLHLTEKAMFRAARFFEAFGEEFDELVVDEETGIVLEPDLSGIAVEVKTFIDGQWGNKIDEPPVVISKGKARKAKPKDEDEDEDDGAPRKRSSRKASDDDDDEDDDDDGAPAKGKRRGRALR